MNLILKHLQLAGISPDENLGQHFLIDQAVIDLLAGCVIERDTVIEVGAGVGQLTEALAKRASRVISIEIDERYKPILTQIVHKHSNVKMIFGDALSIGFQKYLPAQIISSLPYHITEPFLRKIIGLPIKNAVLVVGERLGKAIRAKDETDPNFSQRGLLVQTFFDAEFLADVKKQNFFPIPRTDSIVIKLTPKNGKDVKRSKREFILSKLFLSSSHSPTVKNCIKESLTEYSLKQLTQNQARDIIASLKIPQAILDKPFDQLSNEELGILSKSLRILDIV